MILILDSESISFGSFRTYKTITKQSSASRDKQFMDQETGRIKRQKLEATEYPFMVTAITKPNIVQYNLTKNYVIGSWPTINPPDREILEPMPTPMAFQHPAHGSYLLPVTVPGHHFLATTNDDQAAGAWTRALPISNILSQEKRQIQGTHEEKSGLAVKKSPQILQIGPKSDKVSQLIAVEHNLTINPFFIDEDYFDKEKSEYLSTLGPGGEYHN